MKNKKIHIAILLIILLSFGVAAFFYNKMPDRMISHWNAAGQPNGYMNKCWALYLMPVITVIMYLMFLLIPKIDPLKKNIDKFRKWFDWFILLLVMFLFYIYMLTIDYNLGFKFDMTRAILPFLGIFFIFIGEMLKHSKRNWFIGIRTPWTLSSDRVWEKTHLLGSKLFTGAGVITILAVLFSRYAFWVVIIAILWAGIYPVFYSYFEYKKKS